MKFRDIYEGKKQLSQEQSRVLQLVAESLLEGEMKFQALGMAKELHNKLAGLTFIDMLAVMSSSNPAKKEVQDLETAINSLTSEVGDFIQKYIPDVADADVGDTEEYAEPEEVEEPKEPEEEPKEPKEEPKDAKPATTDKAKDKKIKDNEKDIKESLDESKRQAEFRENVRTAIKLLKQGLSDKEVALRVMVTKNPKKGEPSDLAKRVVAQAHKQMNEAKLYHFIAMPLVNKGKLKTTDSMELKAPTAKAARERAAEEFGLKPNQVKAVAKYADDKHMNEGSPIQDFKTLMYKTMYGKEYEMAIKMMQDEDISAADAAKRFRHVDARALAELFKKY